MEKFRKKDLMLRETTYKVKNVRLKEIVTPQNIYAVASNDVNKLGTTSFDLNTPTNQPTYVKGIYNVGDTESLKSASEEMATQVKNLQKSNPTQPIIGQMTGVKQSNSNTTDKSGDVEQLGEGITFTKREMTDFLKTL